MAKPEELWRKIRYTISQNKITYLCTYTKDNIMKRTFLILTLAATLFSCKNDKGTATIISGSSGSGDNDSISQSYTALVEQFVVADTSITTGNAYSNLFIDSSALSKFITENTVNETDAKGMVNFYKNRNYQFAWFSQEGLTEQGRGFWSLYSYDEKRSADKGLKQRMDTLAEKDTLQIPTADSSFIKTEIALTKAFIQYARTNPDKIFANRLSINRFVPAKQQAAAEMADSILNESTDTANIARNPYALLKMQLRKYADAAKQGGWQPIILKGKVKKGSSSPIISTLKKRMLMTGDLSGADTSMVFNDTLETAVKSYQQRTGFAPTGIINDSLIKALNVSATDRMEQIMINMNRMLWLPANISDNHITVNIPSFSLSVYEANAIVFDMNVIAGKQGSNTMMFYGDLNQIVFSPYWNVPESIVKNELMPAIRKNSNYLKTKNMEIVGRGNDSIPKIRQLPGHGNSLGKVKFLFPNSYDIYFHDTEAKNLFNKKNRALSHGCIRMQDPTKMATYLLRNDASWSPAKINEAMNSTKEQYVKVSKPVPVIINYFTAWADENGMLNFRDDVYGKDKEVTQKMFKRKEAEIKVI